MKILAIEKAVPGTPDWAFAPYLATEAREAWRLHQDGILRELYFRADSDEAVLVLECTDAAAARRALAELPLVQAGLIDFDLIPLRAYPGFARLFATGPEA